MGQKKWLETEQSVSDILKLKPGLDFDQEEKEMRIQRIMNLAAFNGKKVLVLEIFWCVRFLIQAGKSGLHRESLWLYSGYCFSEAGPQIWRRLPDLSVGIFRFSLE